MLETTIRQRLDAALCVLSADSDQAYRDALVLHHQSAGILDHLIKVGGWRPVGMRQAPMTLTALWMLYSTEYGWRPALVSLGHLGAGVSAHFLEWAENRLPGRSKPDNLRGLIRCVLAIWREANPGVVVEPCGGKPGSGQFV